MFFEIIVFVALLLLSQLLKPKPKDESARPASLGDFQFPTATEGRPVPIFWGTVQLKGPNVIWYGDLRQVPITQKQKTGLFSSTTVTIGYKYFLGVQMALCRGGNTPLGGITRIWVGDDLAWTGSLTADGDTSEVDFSLGGDQLGQGSIAAPIRFHSGSYSQGVNAYLSTFQSIGGATSAYRGTAYVQIEAGYLGNTTSIKAWSFEAFRIPNGLGLATPGVNAGKDANPMNVIYEILTNIEWGLGRPTSDINATSFTTAANTLLTEGNGFSFVMDSPITASDLLAEIERQIDGVLYINRTTGKFEINLARGGYTLSTKKAINAGNILEITSFSRGSWDDTTNNVLVHFNNRALDYKDTYAGAQDMANMRLQGNKIVSVTQEYPGVKDATLGNSIAWRNLRTLAYPLAKAEVVCDRTVYDQNMGDVVRWTDPDLGFTDLPMRIKKVDLGELVDGKITLSLVQDIFVFDVAAFAAPTSTQWTPPPTTIQDIVTADRVIFEAPRAFCNLATDRPGTLNRIWVGCRYQGDSAVDFTVVGRPNSGSYTPVGDVSGFLVAGTLSTNLDASATQGSFSITLTPGPDTKFQLLAATEASVTASDCGTRLANPVLIGSEFMLFKTAVPSGANVSLGGGYRGVLDTAPANHTAGDRVFVLYPGNIMDSVFAPGTTENIKPLGRGRTTSLAEASATATNVVMSNRAQRPYPPSNQTQNNVAWQTSTNIDTVSGGGPTGGLDDYGIAIGFTRRDYRTGDEAAAVVNESTLPGDFPTANTTQYQVELRNDPAGANTVLFTTAFNAGVTPIKLSRTLILRNTTGVIPSTVRATVKTQHVDSGVTYSANQNLVWDFGVTASVLGGTFNWAVLANGVASANYGAANTGTFTLTIGTALASGDVQVSVNGGAFASVVVATGTTGTFTAASGDTIRVRHNQGGSNTSQTICILTFGGTPKAYAILTY